MIRTRFPFPINNKYRIIYADPPWKYSDKGCRGAAEHHYKTMRARDLKTLPVSNIADNPCILFMWAVYPMIQDALDLGQVWGFKYKTLAFQWVKTNKKDEYPFFGTGHWTRSNTEPCLLFVRGNPKRVDASISQVIIAPRGEHSEKPIEVRDLIVQLCGDLPRIELFARRRCEGWEAWGDQV